MLGKAVFSATLLYFITLGFGGGDSLNYNDETVIDYIYLITEKISLTKFQCYEIGTDVTCLTQKSKTFSQGHVDGNDDSSDLCSFWHSPEVYGVQPYHLPPALLAKTRSSSRVWQ